MTDPTPAGVYWGSNDAVADQNDTYDNDDLTGKTYDEVGFVGVASMKGTA